MTPDDRFDRIEAKIDSLADAVSRLVVIDEKIANQNTRIAQLEGTGERIRIWNSGRDK